MFVVGNELGWANRCVPHGSAHSHHVYPGSNRCYRLFFPMVKDGRTDRPFYRDARTHLKKFPILVAHFIFWEPPPRKQRELLSYCDFWLARVIFVTLQHLNSHLSKHYPYTFRTRRQRRENRIINFIESLMVNKLLTSLFTFAFC